MTDVGNGLIYMLHHSEHKTAEEAEALRHVIPASAAHRRQNVNRSLWGVFENVARRIQEYNEEKYHDLLRIERMVMIMVKGISAYTEALEWDELFS